MTVRELLHALIDHTADGRGLDEELLIKINGDIRTVSTSFSDGTFILLAGRKI